MKCPKCNEIQYCPCPACVERHKQDVTWIWVTGNGPIKCGHCGHEMSVGEWEQEEWNQYEM
jgi:aspartate carbamoyltransferase regulatory subunit